MAKVLWSDILDGDLVELGGREWTVERIKLKGKRAKVTVRSGGRTASSEVRASDRVKKLKKTTPPLRNAENGQARWATKSEAKASGIRPGNVKLTEPPEKPGADVWDSPRDRIEKKLDAVLGAHLVGEATDEDAGYYVPMPDVSTIASHMALFHPNTYDPEKDEGTMLAGHAHEHRMVLDGKARLDLVHWHTKTRPDKA